MTRIPNNPNFESLTLFFPMWNEELTLPRTVAAAHEIGSELVASGEIGSYRILIVDDASTDTTGALADKLASDDHRVRVVHHPVNRKLGGSVKTGLAEADGSLVLYTDADMPFDLADLTKAVRLLRVYDADIVSAYRFDRTGEGWRRALYSSIYNLLARSLLGLSVRDVNFAFKLVRREVLDHVELRSEGSFIDAELLARAKSLGFHIIQFGVDFFPRSRGVSTLSSPSVILHIVKEMATLLPDIRALKPLSAETRRPGRSRS
jgi:glycosyltransferase involved in cell wall biosynthesis